MGMYNAIIDDEHLNPAGIYKERLSQSALVAEMRRVTTAEARAAYDWLTGRGMAFRLGSDGATELTEDQVLDQLRLYIAATRIADAFGCDAIGIQYQQGLKDMAPASDLAEGLLNDADRPPVLALGESRELYAGRPVVHFNEVDEGSAVDALDHEPGLDGARARSRHDPARRALGRAVRRRLRVGLRDLRRRAAGAPRRRLRGRRERAPAAGVLRARRRHDQGREPAGRDRLEPRLPHGRPAARGPRAGDRGRAADARRPNAAGRRRRRSGRSCTRSSTA